MKASRRPRIAVVGTGIAGLSAAWGLRDMADLALFEGKNRAGGHTNTVMVGEEGKVLPIDTGFLVFNKVTYPSLCQLFRELDVPVKRSEMSLSVQHVPTGLEYNGMGLNKVFAQRKNLANPRFLLLLAEILRFFRIGRRWLREGDGVVAEPGEDLATFCRRNRFGDDFRDLYLVPMSSAIWSTEPGKIMEFPAVTLLRFFHNHGFLGVTTHHPWYTVDGGAGTYVRRMIDRLGAPKFGDPVVRVEQVQEGVLITAESGMQERFDAAILAAHADQSLRMLAQPNADQSRLLSRFVYQRNETLLHTDASVMPRLRRAWASWNFKTEENRNGKGHQERHTTTTHYWMNALQGVSRKRDYFVSLNSTSSIDPGRVLYSTVYHHPVFTLDAIGAQQELPRLNQEGRLFFCGSYFRHGFHEDACLSGFEAASAVRKRFAPIHVHGDGSKD